MTSENSSIGKGCPAEAISILLPYSDSTQIGKNLWRDMYKEPPSLGALINMYMNGEIDDGLRHTLADIKNDHNRRIERYDRLQTEGGLVRRYGKTPEELTYYLRKHIQVDGCAYCRRSYWSHIVTEAVRWTVPRIAEQIDNEKSFEIGAEVIQQDLFNLILGITDDEADIPIIDWSLQRAIYDHNRRAEHHS
jgi:hypothetical protein